MKETRLRGSAEDGKGVGDGSKVRLTVTGNHPPVLPKRESGYHAEQKE